jgi:DNA ligase (NAD+)
MGRSRGLRVSKTATQSRVDPIGQEILRLEELLGHHKDLYYNKTPEISDAEYDALEEELRNLREQNKDVANQVAPNSALDQVGARPVAGSEVKHNTPMLSLDKVHTEADLRDWIAKHPNEEFAVWPKFDGVSLSLTYKDGRLIQAASRGDGQIGEDVTESAKRIIGVHLNLKQKIDCEIRGEVVMLHSSFDEYNKNYPNSPLANPRNAVSGTLRLKDGTTEQARARKLHFYPFDLIINGENPKGQLNQELEKIGYSPEGYFQSSDIDEIIKTINGLETNRDSLNYEIDGAVIKIADADLYRSLGATSKHPRGAMAMKLAAEIGETTIEEVEWAVGKSGNVTPRAKIKSLYLAGTNINYATLHNLEDIERKGIRVGQRVQIKRAGDVIPFIIGPVGGSEKTGQEISAPKQCPSCSTNLVEVGDAKILHCPNKTHCPAQASKRLEHWVSRTGADIEGLSAKTLQKLEDSGLVQHPSDIYALRASDISGLEGMGMKSAENIIASIEKKKDLGLRKALIAFAIPGASEGTAKRLCLAGYKNPEEIAAATPDKLAQVEDIGPIVAESVHQFFQTPEIQQEIKKLRGSGVNLDVKKEDQASKKSGPLAGKSVCLTGTLSVSRSEMKKKLEAAGAKPTGSISKNTDFLLAGDSSGSKLDKAKSLGVRVVSESEINQMI